LAFAASTATGARADEDGVSFWIPGFYGSLAATPQQPGWSIASIFYNTNVSASAAAALSREITIGQFNPALNISVNANLHANVAAEMVIPTYVFATHEIERDRGWDIGASSIHKNDRPRTNHVGHGRPLAAIYREVEFRGQQPLGGVYSPANAVLANSHALGMATSSSNFHLARAVVRGPRGGGAVVGPRGAVVRGPRGGRAVVGRRYYGGVWYGTGRRYWGGRWWPYGVGRCWRRTPIGFVWVCG
jgi:hypothetical protein